MEDLRSAPYSALLWYWVLTLGFFASLAMPLAEFPEWTWYGLIAVPLLAASWAAAKASGYSLKELGLVLDASPKTILWTVMVGLSGFGLGYLEFRILRPEALVIDPSPAKFLVVGVMLMIGTGLTEELIFRGVLQIASIELFGTGAGILLSSALFAIMHIGHKSAVDVLFVFAVAIAFGFVVRFSNSLVGVTIAHGLTNICLFVFFPNIIGVT